MRLKDGREVGLEPLNTSIGVSVVMVDLNTDKSIVEGAGSTLSEALEDMARELRESNIQ